MAEERITADTSYIFSEQLDKTTGVPVGLAPLESVYRKQPDLFSFAPGAKIHDVGVGRGGSADFLLSKNPADVVRTLNLVTSDPYPESVESLGRLFDQRVGTHAFFKEGANEAVSRERDCDLIAMINMIHLVPEPQRTFLIRESSNSLRPGGLCIISTTFFDEWMPTDEHEKQEVTEFLMSLSMISAREVLKRKIMDKDEFRRGLDQNRLVFWSASDYIKQLQDAGLEIVFPQDPENPELQTMPSTVESYRLIMRDREWLDHTLPGVDYRTATEISHKALDDVIAKKGWTEDHPLPRNTLVIVARKAA